MNKKKIKRTNSQTGFDVNIEHRKCRADLNFEADLVDCHHWYDCDLVWIRYLILFIKQIAYNY